MFNIRNIEKTLVTATQENKITSDCPEDFILCFFFEMRCTDLQNDKISFRKFKPIIGDFKTKKKNLINIYDMVCPTVKNWQTMLKVMLMSNCL